MARSRNDVNYFLWEDNWSVKVTIFIYHGLPEQLVSENGPHFTSSEFKQFLLGNWVKHNSECSLPSSIKWPCWTFCADFETNVESYCSSDGKSIHHRHTEFLFEYLETPHAITNVAPKLSLNHKLRARFDLMMPNTKRHAAVAICCCLLLLVLLLAVAAVASCCC